MSTNLEITVVPERPQVGAASGEDRQTHFLVKLLPSAAGQRRVPLDICFVLDCSGTMRRFQLSPEEIAHWTNVAHGRGELQIVTADRREGAVFTGLTAQELQAAATRPLVTAARAIKRVIGALGEADSASLIAFANRAATVYDGTPGLDKAQVFVDYLEHLTDSDAFNLGDGTVMASAVDLTIKQVERTAQPGGVTRVIIMTDGIVHDPNETLRRLETLRAQGLGITTVGIGQDFDEEFLMRIADRSGGQYYYAADPNQLGDQLKIKVTIRTLQSIIITLYSHNLFFKCFLLFHKFGKIFIVHRTPFLSLDKRRILTNTVSV